MSVYRPTYKDPKTGETKKTATWWYEFTYMGNRYREPANTKRKTLAVEAEKTATPSARKGNGRHADAVAD
jgi:hypothetical protein